MERALASIQRIGALDPIVGADRIEVATIKGWKVIVKKGEFNVDDKCIYCEIDSVLPAENPEFEFMQARSKGRVKTMRMRGVLSQGIAFPLSIHSTIPQTPSIDTDVTELLGITKYEPPIDFKQGASKGTFPGFIPKTDELRIQSKPELLTEITGERYVITEKVDGTSATFFTNDGEFGVCSRNMEKKIDGQGVYSRIAKEYKLQEILEDIEIETGIELALQGEIAGPGIQKNRLGLNELQLFLFTGFDIKEGKYLDHLELSELCARWELPMVYVVEYGLKFGHTLDSLLELAKGKYKGTTNNREGIVIRPVRETISTLLHGRLSFKVINNDFLEKGEE
jgi:RNA ligase (TIGR02306 family)